MGNCLQFPSSDDILAPESRSPHCHHGRARSGERTGLSLPRQEQGPLFSCLKRNKLGQHIQHLPKGLCDCGETKKKRPGRVWSVRWASLMEPPSTLCHARTVTATACTAQASGRRGPARAPTAGSRWMRHSLHPELNGARICPTSSDSAFVAILIFCY